MDALTSSQTDRPFMLSGQGSGEDPAALRNARLTCYWVTLSLLCAISVVEIETICRIPFLNAHRLGCFIALGSIALVIRGVWRNAPQGRSDVDQILSFYRNPSYWMVLLLAAAVIAQAVLPFRSPAKKPEPVVVAAPPPPPPKPAPAPAPAPKPIVLPPAFPELRVSGFVLNGSRSSAVINGQTVMLGEDIKGVTLVKVDETKIVVRQKTWTREYRIGKPK